eukprot:239552-Chlamydomonas_euryale.AAC.2
MQSALHLGPHDHEVSGASMPPRPCGARLRLVWRWLDGSCGGCSRRLSLSGIPTAILASHDQCPVQSCNTNNVPNGSGPHHTLLPSHTLSDPFVWLANLVSSSYQRWLSAPARQASASQETCLYPRTPVIPVQKLHVAAVPCRS